MSPLEKVLHGIHPEARIVSVETDEHEHRDTVCCDITGKRLIEDEELLDGCGAIWAKVARIVFAVPGEEPEVLSKTDNEWVPYSEEVIREALEMARDTVTAVPATNANVSVRAKQIAAIDSQIDELALKGVA